MGQEPHRCECESFTECKPETLALKKKSLILPQQTKKEALIGKSISCPEKVARGHNIMLDVR
eukprot:scaffold17674_cov148-Skeletonema_marinoi.AAC.6